jgi:hypothetical protein
MLREGKNKDFKGTDEYQKRFIKDGKLTRAYYKGKIDA